MKNSQPEITKGQILMEIQHNNESLIFVYPAFCSNIYQNVGRAIQEKGLQVPSGDETASLLHAAYCSNSTNEPKFQNIQSIMKSNWLWVYNQNLWTDKGVYVVKDLKALGRSQLLNINDLEKILKNGKEIQGTRFSEDNLVRFAPKESYDLENVSPEKFAKNGFIIASCGIEGAEKLAEVSTKFRDQPYIYGLDIEQGNLPEQRISAVYELGVRLRFDGHDWGGDYGGHAFGILKEKK